LLNILIAVGMGFSVVFSQKIMDKLSVEFNLDGGFVMNLITMVTSYMAGTGACGIRDSNG